MSNLVTQELAIVVSVKIQNPTLLNEDFLKQAGIVPADWKLSREPVYTDRVAQLVFENGFSIAAQPDRVMFLEAVGDRPIAEIKTGAVAHKYVETLKLADYQAIGINFRGYVAQSSTEAANAYINSQLMAGGNWQTYGRGVRSSVNLVYDLSEERQLNLSINEASIQFPEQPPTPVVLFSANFSYDVSTAAADDKASKVAEFVDRWPQDLSEYSTLITNYFLGETAPSKSAAEGKSEAVAEDVGVADAAEWPSVLATAK
jgi:hypothetical protein